MRRMKKAFLSTLVSLSMLFTCAAGMSMTVSADSNVLTGGTNVTLQSGTYYVNDSVTYTGEAGQSALVIASGATVKIYVNSGATLTATGGAGSGTTGGGAGIEVPADATLYLLGEGTVNITGGAAADGGNGSDGGNGKGYPSNQGGTGGNGGNGGGGAGAGIGTKGGNGGVANNGAGTPAGSCGYIYIARTLTKTVKGGNEGVSGSAGNSGQTSVGGDYRGGGGGGAGSGGGAGADLGNGGSGGGAGGQGGNGARARTGSQGNNGAPGTSGTALTLPQITSLTASPITTGQTLADSTLSGTASDGTGSVNGAFSWLDSTIQPAEGTVSYDAVFTPENMGSYVGIVTKVAVTTGPYEPYYQLCAGTSKLYIYIYAPYVGEDTPTVTWGTDVLTTTGDKTQEGKRCAEFVISCAAKNMVDENSVVIASGGEDIYTGTFSVAGYLSTIVNDQDYGALATAMLRYGAAAQLYFGYRTGELIVSEAELAQIPAIPDQGAPTVEQISEALTVENAEYEYYGMNVTFTYDTTLLIAFKITGDSAMARTQLERLFPANAISPDNSGYYYIVRVRDIGIRNLANDQFANVGVRISVTDYLERAVAKYNGSNYDTLCRALYAYYAAANALPTT